MPNSSVLGLLGDPTLEEEFRRLKKRDLTESYLFNMACGSSRPLKCRNNVISKQMVDKRNAITCRPLPRNFSVLPDTPASENRCASLHLFTHYPGKKPEEHPEWVSERKAFRQALDGMGDLRRWLHSKPILTDMEVFITEREGQAKMMSLSFPEKCNYPSPPDAAASPCALKHEVEEVKRYLRTFKLLACNLSKYLDWHGTGKIKRADLHVMFEKEGFLLQPERLDALMSSLNSMDGNSVTVADLAAGIQAWSTKLKDREEQRANSDNQRVVGSRSNLQTYGIINDQREDQDEEGLQDMEVLVIMRRVLGSKIQDTFPCPSTLSGPMGREVDHYRRLCFREYLKSLEQCQQNIHNVSQATLQKVLLHPSDKSISSCSKMGGKDLFPGRGRHERGLASLCTPKMYRVENEKGAPRKCHKKEYRKKQSSSWADPNAFWPGREDHVRLFLPVMKQSPAMVLFQCIERTAAPSPGNWPINHLGYSTSGDIGAHKVYTL